MMSAHLRLSATRRLRSTIRFDLSRRALDLDDRQVLRAVPPGHDEPQFGARPDARPNSGRSARPAIRIARPRFEARTSVRGTRRFVELARHRAGER